jgi:FHA domain
MAVCPNGHDSASDDFCDTCGMRIGASGAPPTAWPDPAASAPTGPAPAADPCPRCGTPRNGQFCEACGYNFAGPRFTPTTAAAPPPPAPRAYSSSQPGPGTGSYSSSQPGPGSGGYSSAQAPPQPSMSSFPYPQATWTAVVGADRAYYERVQAVTGPEGSAVSFPSYYAERRFQLVGNQMRIGRRSVSRGLAPEIDLTGPPADPGISRLHAVLISTPDGNWAVLDPGSANGTLLNGSEIGVGDQVPLHDGDRINLGAWTAITVHRG